MTLSISERLARMRQAPAVPSEQELEAAMPATASGVTASGDVVAKRQPTYAEVTGRPERVAPPLAASAAGDNARFMDRMRNLTQRVTNAAPARPATEEARGRPVLPWNDASRPAGSVFSPEEWAAVRAECGFTHAIVFEVHKAAERGLVPLDAASIDGVHAMFLDQALLIDERLGEHPAWQNARAHLEHHTTDLGTWTYRVVHAAEAIARCPGLIGAKLVEGEPPARSVSAPRSRP